MAVVKVKGLVLKEIKMGESNKQLILLTQQSGKIFLSARGAQKANSRFLASSQLFAYSEFLAYDGQGYLAVTQANILESFYALRQDLEKLSFACYFLELADKTLPFELSSNDGFLLLLRTLTLLCRKPQYPILQAAGVFGWKWMQIHGFMPEIGHCLSCQKKLEGRTFFDLSAGGVVCEHCAAEGKIPLSKEGYQALCYLLEQPLSRCFFFYLPKQGIHELAAISFRFITIHIGEKLESLAYAKKIYGC